MVDERDREGVLEADAMPEECFLFDMRVDFMENPEDRRASFDDDDEPYPGIRRLIDDFVDAGFYYEGYDDELTCYWCAGSINDWLDMDVPWEEHARLVTMMLHH